uniref:Uncharacterized protein n=1 Tax=Panagrellus redivivus TaxID=6233 RepID=A0A7E4VL46_PANRE
MARGCDRLTQGLISARVIGRIDKGVLHLSRFCSGASFAIMIAKWEKPGPAGCTLATAACENPLIMASNVLWRLSLLCQSCLSQGLLT